MHYAAILFIHVGSRTWVTNQLNACVGILHTNTHYILLKCYMCKHPCIYVTNKHKHSYSLLLGSLLCLHMHVCFPHPKCPSSALIFVEIMRHNGSGRSGFCCHSAVWRLLLPCIHRQHRRYCWNPETWECWNLRLLCAAIIGIVEGTRNPVDVQSHAKCELCLVDAHYLVSNSHVNNTWTEWAALLTHSNFWGKLRTRSCGVGISIILLICLTQSSVHRMTQSVAGC